MKSCIWRDCWQRLSDGLKAEDADRYLIRDAQRVIEFDRIPRAHAQRAGRRHLRARNNRLGICYQTELWPFSRTCIAPVSARAALGHDLPVRQCRAGVSSVPESCRSRALQRVSGSGQLLTSLHHRASMVANRRRVISSASTNDCAMCSAPAAPSRFR